MSSESSPERPIQYLLAGANGELTIIEPADPGQPATTCKRGRMADSLLAASCAFSALTEAARLLRLAVDAGQEFSVDVSACQDPSGTRHNGGYEIRISIQPLAEAQTSAPAVP